MRQPPSLCGQEGRSGIAPVSLWTFPVGRGICACAPRWVRSPGLQKHTGRSGGMASWHLGAPPRAPSHPGKPDSGHCCQCVLSVAFPLSSAEEAPLSLLSTGLSGLGPGGRQLAEAGGRTALSCCSTRPVHLLALGCSGLLVGRLFGSLFVQNGSAAPPGCWVLCRELVWPLPSCTQRLMGQRRWRLAGCAVAEGS